MPLATKDQIRNSKDYAFEDVEVPKWGTVRIRMLSASERLKFVAKFGDQVRGKEAFDLTMDVVLTTAIDEEGNPLFTQEDADWLFEKNWNNIQLLATRALTFNGLTEEVIKEAEKKSEGALSGETPSVSA